MFKKVVTCLIILPVLSFISGCASYRFGRLPSPYIIDHPGSITQKDVSVTVKFINSSEAETTFDCEMAKRKINPVFIVIENKSNIAYSFRKEDIDSSYLAAEEVAKKCARSTMGRVATYGILGLAIISWIVFIPMAIGEAINCPRINSQMRNDYISNEIADATIAPGRSLSGVMFVAPFRSGEIFNIPLVNRDTGERLIFQFQNTQLGIVSVDSQEKKEELKEKKEPKKNFGP